MLCPFCREKDTSVVDSRPTEDGTAIRRRRLCGCNRKERFTTFERVQFQELTVIKGNGKREPFDRDKISKSIRIATRKRPCLLYTSPSPRDRSLSRMPSSA